MGRYHPQEPPRFEQEETQQGQQRPWTAGRFIGLVIVGLLILLFIWWMVNRWQSARQEPSAVTTQAPGEPTAAFTLFQHSVSPRTFEFDATSSEDDKGIVEYRWNFGDGFAQTGKIAIPHTYPELPVEKVYTAKLTVKDTDGNVDDEQKDVTVPASATIPSVTTPSQTTTPSTTDFSDDAAFNKRISDRSAEIKKARKGE